MKKKNVKLMNMFDHDEEVARLAGIIEPGEDGMVTSMSNSSNSKIRNFKRSRG